MRSQGIKVIITFFMMLVFGILAWVFAETFFDFVYHQFDDVNVQLISTELLGQFRQTGDFSASLAMLPLLFLFSAYILSREHKVKLFFTSGVILICGIGLLFIYISYLKTEASRFQIMPRIQNTLSISSIQAGWYLGIGFILGTLISLIFFLLISKQKKPKTHNSHFSSDI